MDQAIIDPWLSGFLEISKIAIGGVVAATLALIFNSRRENQELNRAASSLATRLIDVFERYAIACAEIPNQHGSIVRDDPYDWRGLASLPELGMLPSDDAGWRAIKPQFAIFARTFETNIEQSRGVIRWEAEQGDAEDTESQIERQAMILGRSAWAFACEMRDGYGFEERDIGWDIPRHFCDEEVRFTEHDARRAEANREMWTKMNASSVSDQGINSVPIAS